VSDQSGGVQGREEVERRRRQQQTAGAGGHQAVVEERGVGGAESAAAPYGQVLRELGRWREEGHVVPASGQNVRDHELGLGGGGLLVQVVLGRVFVVRGRVPRVPQLLILGRRLFLQRSHGGVLGGGLAARLEAQVAAGRVDQVAPQRVVHGHGSRPSALVRTVRLSVSLIKFFARAHDTRDLSDSHTQVWDAQVKRVGVVWLAGGLALKVSAAVPFPLPPRAGAVRQRPYLPRLLLSANHARSAPLKEGITGSKIECGRREHFL